MNGVERRRRSVDRMQQHSRWLGFPLAVMGKFRDDHGGALTTVVAYNAFFALFPLLLIAEAQSWYSAGGACGCCGLSARKAGAESAHILGVS